MTSVDSCARCGQPVTVPEGYPAEQLGPLICIGCWKEQLTGERPLPLAWPCVSCGREIRCTCSPLCTLWPCAHRGRHCTPCLKKALAYKRALRLARRRAGAPAA